VVTGNARCTEGWGVGLYDLGLRFHDIKHLFHKPSLHTVYGLDSNLDTAVMGVQITSAWSKDTFPSTVLAAFQEL
jgi:hypothetical protein